MLSETGNRQMAIKRKQFVNNQLAMDYTLDLTSGVTGRNVEQLRLSARFAFLDHSRILNIGYCKRREKNSLHIWAWSEVSGWT